MNARLKNMYDKEITSRLMTKLNYNNKHQVPKLIKVVLNMGLGSDANDNKKIIKEYKFKNHYELIAMINLIAWISHREDHHPEILFSYSNLTVTYYTYAIDGLSENDFICAAKIDNSVRL